MAAASFVAGERGHIARPAWPRPPRPLRPLPGGVRARLVAAAVGPIPVTLIGASTFGLDLRLLACAVLLPGLAVLTFESRRSEWLREQIAMAVQVGLVATAAYDTLRFAFMAAHLIGPDPIPHIGTALGIRPVLVTGYAWRYLGNGTGLALAFLALGLRGTKAGIAYGLAVCAGLFTVLIVSPYGQATLFRLTPATVVMATLGHAVYGGVLGRLAGPRVRTPASSL